MANSNMTQFTQESELWDSLKKAISQSSGFKNWLEHNSNAESFANEQHLDELVLVYLRETLDTLAY